MNAQTAIEAAREYTGPHPVDIVVGNAVRLRRRMIGLSQSELAQAVGVTFQQIQKYERGTNRISASKLHDIAKALRVPISFFFEGASTDLDDGETVQSLSLSSTEADTLTKLRLLGADDVAAIRTLISALAKRV